MMPGIDPQQLLEAQKMGKHVKAVIRTNYSDYTVHLTFSSEISGMDEFLRQLTGQLSDALAAQLSSFFAIKGEIIEVGKEEKPSGKE